MIKWIKDKWDKFQAWVYSWMPGWKTKMVSAIGGIGMAAGYLQEYISGLPLDKFMTANEVAISGAVLFTLAYWFKHLADDYSDN